MGGAHPYIPNSAESSKHELLKALGISSPEELYADIPPELRLKRRLVLPGPFPEQEILRLVRERLSSVRTALDMPVFLGAGCWPHHVPAAVDFIVARTEFLTAYTPYQPEVSQGMLQALWEYQSLICELTGMEVANCSMYDWASALGEAARMAARVTKRTRILVPKIIHPDRLAALRAYTEPADIKVELVPYEPDDPPDREELVERARRVPHRGTDHPFSLARDNRTFRQLRSQVCLAFLSVSGDRTGSPVIAASKCFGHNTARLPGRSSPESPLI